MDELQLSYSSRQSFLFWGKKAIFAQEMAAQSKKSYSPKYVYWYEWFSV